MLTGGTHLRQARAAALLIASIALGALLAQGGVGASPAVAAEPPASAFTFGYDAVGRLIEASIPSSNTDFYNWDGVGNLTSITQQSSTKISIGKLVPNSGPVGSLVRVDGTDFGATVAQNTVTFSGTVAAVASASPTQLVLAVPNGAKTGQVKVVAPAGSATSTESFTVTAPKAPAITSVSTTLATAGTSFTVSGTNFETEPAKDALAINQSAAEVSSATTTSLSSVIPIATGSGQLKLDTPSGEAVGPDVYIPPEGLASEVVQTTRMTIGGTQEVHIASEKKRAMIIFDGQAGQRAYFNFTEVTFKGCCNAEAKLYDPHNQQVGSAVTVGESGRFIDTTTLPSTGTYTMLVTAKASTGTMKLSVKEVPEDFKASITPTESGASQAVETTATGQNAELSFHGVAGQRVFLIAPASGWKFPAGCCKVEVSIQRPDGPNLVGPKGLSGGSYIDTVTLPVSGTYTILVDPEETATGSATLTAYLVPEDFEGSIAPSEGGGSQTVQTTVPGQNAKLTFGGAAGQRVFVTAPAAGWNYAKATVSIQTPEGTNLASPKGFSGGSYIDTVTLPVSGTYTIFVDPQELATGSATLTAYLVPEDSKGSIAPSEAGGSQTVETTIPGQNAKLSFSGAAGQRVFVTAPAAGWNYAKATVSIQTPEGTNLATPRGFIGGSYIDTVMLPVSGTYTILVDPQDMATGSATLTAYLVPADFSASIAPSGAGASQTVETTVPGQNARLTFTGTAGQRVFVTAPAAGWKYPTGCCKTEVSIQTPEGTNLTSPKGFGNGSYVDTVTLPVSGTYTILFNPQGTLTGSATLTVYLVPEDFKAAVSPNEAGASQTVETTVPGQSAKVTFTGSKGERVFIETPEVSYGAGCCEAEMRLEPPEGKPLASPYVKSGSYIDTTVLPLAGTYTVVVDPQGAVTGKARVVIHTVPEDVKATITPSESGGAQTVSTKAVGQNAAVTFSATAGERVFIETPEVNYGTTCCNLEVELRPPEGKALASPYMKSGSYIDTTLLEKAGTYTLSVNPIGAATGTLKLTVFKVPADVSKTIQIGGPAVSVATTVPGQKAAVTFSGSANKAIKLTASEVKIGTSTCCSTEVTIKKPEGTSLISKFVGTNGATLESTLPVAGTYTIVVDPREASKGSMTLTLVDPPSGALPSSAPSATALVSRLAGDWRATQPSVRVPDARGGRRSGHVSAKVPDKGGVPVRSSRDHVRRASKQPRVGRRVAIGSVFRPLTGPHWTPSASDRRGGWNVGGPSSPLAKLPALQAPAETTALAGQALRLNGEPLADVSMSIEGTSVETRTDSTGRFLLSGLPSGHQVLVVEGASADGRGASYGRFEIGVNLQASVTSTLPFTIWMPALDEKHRFNISSPTHAATTLRTPDIPGLEIHIPAGTVVTDSAGRTVRQLTITAVPIDRPPFPLPMGSAVPLYFTVQPGGAYLSKGVQITYPNYTHMPAGQRVPFWNYDPDKRGWYVYGQGTVTSDGKQIVPDPGVKVWEFSGAMIGGTPLPPLWWDPFCWLYGACQVGEPVDLDSGLYVMRKTDLAEYDVIPLALTRVYRPSDNNSYAFGIGMSDDYDMRLWSNNNYQEADLILPEGSRIHYHRISEGTGFTDAVYEATNTAGPYYASKISRGDSGWNLRLRDGLTYHFPDYKKATWIRDRFGNQLTLTRDISDNLVQVTSPHGRWIKFTHDTHNRIAAAHDSLGRTVTYEYDSSGRLAKVIDAAAGTTTYSYDTKNEMTSIVDPRNYTYLTNHYDASGRIEQQQLADGAVYRFSYTGGSETNKVTQGSVTEPNGNVTQASFNADGLPTAVTYAAGTPIAETSTFEAEPGSDLLRAVTDPLGRRTAYTYDALGNVATVTHMAGTEHTRTTTYTHEPAYSQLTSVTDPLNHKITAGYDSLGELTTVTDALENTWSIGYAGRDGEATSLTDPLGHKTTWLYHQGEPVTITDPAGRTTKLFYDSGSREIALTDPLGNATRYAYDPFDDVTSVVDPSGGETKLRYDGDSDLVSLSDALGHETKATYDSLDRISGYTDALGKSAALTYDGNGNMTGLTDRRGQLTTYGYDALNRLNFIGYGTTGQPPALSYASTIKAGYDQGNRLTEATDSTGGAFKQTWDSFNDLTEEAGPNGSVRYGYDSAGRRTGMTVSGQPEDTYGYDKANRLTSISGPQSVGLTYDNAGRLTATTLPDGVSENYSYDNASELTGIGYSAGSSALGEIDYAYDGDGRRIATWGSYARLNLPPAFSSATYNADNELTARGSASFGYDANGNLTNEGASNAFSWNARNQMSSLTGAGGTTTFAYDPFGRRESETAGGKTTNFLYDRYNVVQELSGSTPRVNYTLGLALDKRFGRTEASGTQSFLTDALGSAIALASSSGAVQTSYTYDPFGAPTSSGAASTNTYQYTGRENDGTGLQYNRNRYYSASLERFISQDPLGLGREAANTYEYVGDDPLDRVDPRGLDEVTTVTVGGEGGGLVVASNGKEGRIGPCIGSCGPSIEHSEGGGGGGPDISASCGPISLGVSAGGFSGGVSSDVGGGCSVSGTVPIPSIIPNGGIGGIKIALGSVAASG